MSRKIFGAVYLAFTVSALADECLIPNSTSPTGQFAIYAVDSNEPFLPATLEIRDLGDQKSKLRLDVGGYVRLASEYDYGDEDKDSIFVLWSHDGSRVAMMIRDGKRNGSLVIYERKHNSFDEKKLPDFHSAAAKALNFKLGERYGYEFPDAWIGHNELLVKIRCDGINPVDAKTYDYECVLSYQLSTGELSNFKVLSKQLREG
jgi:hypothetical protein